MRDRKVLYVLISILLKCEIRTEKKECTGLESTCSNFKCFMNLKPYLDKRAFCRLSLVQNQLDSILL